MSPSAINWHQRYLKQAQWTQDLRRYLYSRFALKQVSRVLEVGCGTGAILKELTPGGEFAPQGSAVGVDLEQSALLQAAVHTQGADLVQGDAVVLPFPSHTFDLCVCHFLLLWVSQPLQAVSEMARVTRPGGIIAALAEPDYGGRIDFPNDLEILGHYQSDSLRAQGADPEIGRRLVRVFLSAGLQNVESGVMGGQWRASASSAPNADEWEVMESDLLQLPAGPTETELLRLRQIDEDAWGRGERILFVPTFYAWGFAPQRR